MDLLAALSLKGSLVVLAVWAVVALAGKRLPPFAEHLLWSVVFVRLLLPVLPASPWSLLSLGSETPGGGLLPALGELPSRGASGAAPEAAEALPALSWEGGLIALWGIGVTLLVLRLVVAEVRLRRAVGRSPSLTGERIDGLLYGARHTLGLGRRVRIVETRAVAAPAVHGVFRPRLLLPPGFLSEHTDDQIRHVLLHELAHVRRHDLFTQLTARLVTTVHWFNPLAWFALARLEASCETACDAVALTHVSAPTDYGRTLLRVASPSLRAAAPAVTALPLLHPKTLHRRLHMIAQHRPTSPRQILFGLTLLLAFTVTALTDAPVTEVTDGAPAAAIPVDDAAALKQTMADLRNTGVALFAWYTDALENHPDAPEQQQPEETEVMPWSACPKIEADDLAELLVPQYLSELPTTDAWGHELEFCLDTNLTGRPFIMGVRSAGRDGAFEGVGYRPGSFDPSQADRDLVWVNGYFVRWGQKDDA